MKTIPLLKMSAIHLCPLLFWALIKEKGKKAVSSTGRERKGGRVVKWEIWLVPRLALQAFFLGHNSAHQRCENSGKGEGTEKGGKKRERDGRIAIRADSEEIREKEPRSEMLELLQHPFFGIKPYQPHINRANLWKVSLLSGGSPSLLTHFISVQLALHFLVLFQENSAAVCPCSPSLPCNHHRHTFPVCVCFMQTHPSRLPLCPGS